MDQNFRIVERRESKTITRIAPEETFSVPPIDLVVETKSCCSSCRASQFEVEVTGRSVCMFLQNHGYAAAWDHEIKGQPFAGPFAVRMSSCFAYLTAVWERWKIVARIA